MKFDMPKDQSSIIKVVGVGGGGSNAVNFMFNQGINGVDFIVCNTDQQALDQSPVPKKIALGSSLTEGRGAGSLPEVGKNAAIENIDDVREVFAHNTKMVFITAGMGGGTGTGAAPIIAQVAKEMGILTVGIVTIPFNFEGRKRRAQADIGLEELKQNVDTLLVISNDKLREMCGDLKLSEAFAKADNILTVAAKGIAEIITVSGYVNVDFEDVKTVMTNSGVAIMGSATAAGEGRALKAIQNALASPLLNDNNIQGASNILLYMNSGTEELTLDEITEITDYIQDEAGSTAEIIWGNGTDDTLADHISVTIIATGFEGKGDNKYEGAKEPSRIVHKLEDKKPEPTFENKAAEKEDTPTEPETKVDEPVLIKKPLNTEEQISFEFPMKQPKTFFTPEGKTTKPEEEMKEEASLEPELKSTLEVKEETTETAAFAEPELKKTETSLEPELKKTETSADTGETASFEHEDKEMKAALEKSQQERLFKIKQFNQKLKTPGGIAEMEKEPAYLRKNVKLDTPPHSSESNVSRFTLSETDEEGENGEKKYELKKNNPFLHDNVD